MGLNLQSLTPELPYFPLPQSHHDHEKYNNWNEKMTRELSKFEIIKERISEPEDRIIEI